jgi:peptidoglycan hydrolase-like protein with peptidoglycan-binding domain
MSDFSYTNAQFRNILSGLGFRSRGLNEPNFPVSNDESELDNDLRAVIDFQGYFDLVTDGIVGPNTWAIAQQEMYVIQYELDLVMEPEPRLHRQNAPFYGPQTAQAVAYFRRFYSFEPVGNADDNRIADLPVRRKLDKLTPNVRNAAQLVYVSVGDGLCSPGDIAPAETLAVQ